MTKLFCIHIHNKLPNQSKLNTNIFFSDMAPSQSPIISAQYNHLRGAHRIGGGQNGGQNGSSNNSSPRHLHHGQNGHSPSLGDYFFLKKTIFPLV